MSDRPADATGPDSVPGALAAFRRQHVTTVASVFLLDLATTGVLTLVTGRFTAFAAALALSLTVFGLTGAAGAILLTRPLARPGAEPEPVIRRLPALSAGLVATLAFAYCLAAFQLGVFFPDPTALERLPERTKMAASLWFASFYVALYAFFAFHAVDDRCADLRARLQAAGAEPSPGRHGKFAHRLVPVFLFLAGIPASLLALDLGLFREIRAAQGLSIEQTVILDAIAVLAVIALSLFFVNRSLTRPVSLLAEAQRRLEAGDLGVAAPVVSDDELGRLTAAFNRMVRGLRERERLRDAMERFTGSHHVGEAVIGERQVPAVAREATILFTDIEGFATLSEGLPAADVFACLNDYLSAVAGLIREHGGTVNNYLGDSVMGLFGVPEDADGAARRAVLAAVAIQRRLAGRRADGLFAPPTRIGIATGTVHAGVIGDAGRSAYSAYGHAVNLASRLEQANKDFGTAILVDARTRDLAGAATRTRLVGSVALKGIAQPCEVFAVEDG